MLDAISSKLEDYLTFLSQRQRLVASNIANADTPGYRTKDLNFETNFTEAFSHGSATPLEVTGLTMKNDGNNVDLDREARLLSENALRFNVAASLMHSKLKLLKLAIEGGSNS